MSQGEFRSDCRPLIAAEASEWHNADMTATFGADVPWSALDGGNGLWIPADCQGNPAIPIGRLVAQNATGPLRLGFGAWRDLLLGCQFENGRGELITAGGRTVKNVAGYDLTKWMVGQGGIFGRIVTITTRAYRRPDDAVLAEFAPEMDIFNRLLVSPCRPQWAILTERSLTCGYMGNRRTVDYYEGQLPQWNPTRLVRHGFAADVQWRCQHWGVRGAAGMAMRASVPPMRISEFARKAELIDWMADPAFGIVLAPPTALAMDAAAGVGGRAWTWNRADENRLSAFSHSSGERAILQRLKQTMDPDNRLAPLPR